MRARNTLPLGLGPLLAAALSGAACDGPSSSSENLDVGASVPLEGGSTLLFQDGGRLDAHRSQVEQVVKSTLSAVRARVPLDGITILVAAGVDIVIPEIGIGGRSDAGTIRIVLDPSSPELARSLDRELFPLLAHEMHHVARFRAVGLPSNLLEAMVAEGLADHFSIEVAGVDPPLWASALSPDALATWTTRARQEWLAPNYNHDAWFFGTAPPIPRWAGYSIGFDLVRQFLVANPSRLPSDLRGQPALSFVPPGG